MADIRQAILKAVLQAQAKAQIPTAEEEALQDPFIQPETYGLGGPLKGLFALGQSVPTHHNSGNIEINKAKYG